MIHKLMEWLNTLLNHRAIIENLKDRVSYNEDNAFDIINLMTRRNVGVVISERKNEFGYTVMLSRGNTNAYFKSLVKIPPLRGVEHAIFMMDKHDEKKVGKK